MEGRESSETTENIYQDINRHTSNSSTLNMAAMGSPDRTINGLFLTKPDCSTMKMEANGCSETSIDFPYIMRCYVQEDSVFEELKTSSRRFPKD
jgi:hypothetical protein